MTNKNAKNYHEYLRLDALLAQQRPLTKAHDELQFIVIHQTFELWFKLGLYEMESARAAMFKGDLPGALHDLKRVAAILRVLPHAFEVMETMHAVGFLEFRSQLEPGSGLQSVQFREVEFLSGLKDERYVRLHPKALQGRLRKRLKERTLWDAYLSILKRHRMPCSDDARTVRSLTKILRAPDRHPMGPLTEAMLEHDKLISLWRSRHILMTMRMIGAKVGTGHVTTAKLVAAGYDQMGAAGGINYLKTTLPKLLYPLLWEARTAL